MKKDNTYFREYIFKRKYLEDKFKVEGGVSRLLSLNFRNIWICNMLYVIFIINMYFVL